MSHWHTKTVIVFTLLILLAVHVQGQVTPGRITVYSTPSGATACIDIANCDTTPATFSVDGNAWHTISVTDTGYLQYTDTVYVISAQTSVINAVLVQNPSTTGIQVFVTPGGGTVCLDYSQCNPNVGGSGSSGSTQFTGMSAGYHTITVTGLDGYQDYSTPVYVNMGSFSTIAIDLLPSGVTPTPTSSPVFPSAASSVSISTGSAARSASITGTAAIMSAAMPGRNGTTLFSGVAPGFTHTITVTAAGFVPYSTQVSVTKDLESTVDIHLVPIGTPTPTPTPAPTAVPTSVTTAGTPPTDVIPQSTRAGLDPMTAFGALALCCAVALASAGRK